MRTEKNKNLKIGAFVALGIFFFMASIIIIGGDKSIFKNYYTLNVRFKQVQGLTKGSVVSLVGVPIGNVRALTFIPKDNQIEISLDIDKDFQSRIYEGSIVSIKTQGALGDKYLYITPGPLSGRVLKSGEYLITDSKGDLFDIISEEGPKFAKIFEVIEEFRVLLTNINENNQSSKFMQNLVASSEKMNNVLTNIDRLTLDIAGNPKEDKKIKDSIAHLNSILEKIDKGEGTLGALINDPSVHDKIVGLLGKSPRNTYLKPLIRATIKTRDQSSALTN